MSPHEQSLVARRRNGSPPGREELATGDPVPLADEGVVVEDELRKVAQDIEMANPRSASEVDVAGGDNTEANASVGLNGPAEYPTINGALQWPRQQCHGDLKDRTQSGGGLHHRRLSVSA